jgi:NADH:ubiquinone oxidoreductase subunit 2 (subunit N)
VKIYQKLTLITAILGLVVPLLAVFAYVFVNSLTGIPILALFLGTAVLIAVIIIATNVAAIVVAFYIKIQNMWELY